MHQFGWISEREGELFKFASERGGYPESRGEGSLRKRGGGGSNPSGNYDRIPTYSQAISLKNKRKSRACKFWANLTSSIQVTL